MSTTSPTPSPAAVAKPSIPFSSCALEAAYAAFDMSQRTPLLELRDIVMATANAIPACGGVVETLKWGQPSYLPKNPRVGTTVRLSTFGDEKVALYVSCQTDLVERYKTLFGSHLSFSKSRAVVFAVDKPLPKGAIVQCTTLALSYHLDKRRSVG